MKQFFRNLSLTIFSFLLLSLISCSDDDANPLCSGFVEQEVTALSCPAFDDQDQFFIQISQNPFFGVDSSDLENYLLDAIEICGLNEIKDGNISLKVVIDTLGAPCLKEIISRNVFLGNQDGLADAINGMPNWEPGIQMSRKVKVKYTLPIMIK